MPRRTVILEAGLVYFATVFAVGFLLGTVRTLLVLPHVGPVWAVALELPLILAASWLLCGWTLRRFRVAAGRPRLLMGTVALGLLLLAELTLAIALGEGPRAFVTGLVTPAGALGLAGQLAFALFPALRSRQPTAEGGG